MFRDRPTVAEPDANAGAHQVPLSAHLDRLTVQERAAATPRRIKLAGDRMVDNAEHQFAARNQAYGNAPEWNSGQKIVRAVDRVDHPHRGRPRIARTALLAEKAVPRKQPR